MIILYLNLNREFFCEILEGRKTVEYRDKTEYWENHILNKPYTHIRFRNGYLKKAPEMIVVLKTIYETRSKYELQLGKVVAKKNIHLLE